MSTEAERPSEPTSSIGSDPSVASATPERLESEAAPEATTSDPTASDLPAEPPVDMTPAAAPSLCASLIDEPAGLRRSRFRAGGVSLTNGARADVLECTIAEAMYGEMLRAYVVVRVPGSSIVASEMLGEAYDVPGESLSYRLGRLERRPNGVRIRTTHTDTIYPCTGDPEDSCPPEIERDRSVVVCTFDAEYDEYACERE